MHTFFSSLLGPSDQQAVTRFIRCQQSSVEVPVVRALTELQPRRQLSHIPLKHAVCAPHCHTQYQRRLSLAPMHHRHAVVRGAPPGKVALKPLVSVRSRIVSGGTRRRGELHYGPNLARVHVTKGAAPPLPPPGQRPHKLRTSARQGGYQQQVSLRFPFAARVLPVRDVSCQSESLHGG